MKIVPFLILMMYYSLNQRREKKGLEYVTEKKMNVCTIDVRVVSYTCIILCTCDHYRNRNYTLLYFSNRHIRFMLHWTNNTLNRPYFYFSIRPTICFVYIKHLQLFIMIILMY